VFVSPDRYVKCLHRVNALNRAIGDWRSLVNRFLAKFGLKDAFLSTFAGSLPAGFRHCRAGRQKTKLSRIVSVSAIECRFT